MLLLSLICWESVDIAKSSYKNQRYHYLYVYMISFYWTLFRMKKYHTSWGLLETNYVTCTKLRCVQIQIIEVSISSSTTYDKINIDSLQDNLQILWKLLGPLFKGPAAPSAWYQKKVHFLFNTCSEIPYRSWDICIGKVLGAEPVNP